MTMKQKMLRGFIAGVAGLAAATTVVNGGGQPGSAITCQRAVAIDPQVTVSESSRTLTFVVRSNACAEAGSVNFLVTTNGSAQRPDDFTLENGVLTWVAGDVSSRRITATINNDRIPEPLLESFGVILVNPSESVRVTVAGKGEGRIFDDDTTGRFTATDDRICLISGDATCVPKPPNGTVPSPSPVTIFTFEPGHAIIAPIVFNQANPFPSSIQFQTVDGTLVAGLDYVPVNMNVPIPAGATVVEVQIELLPHAYTLPGRFFATQLSNYTAGQIADPIGTVTMVY